MQLFLEGLLEEYCSEATGRKKSGDRDGSRALLLAAAAVELVRGHPLLPHHAVALGYVDRLVKLLAACLPPQPPPGQPCPALC